MQGVPDPLYANFTEVNDYDFMLTEFVREADQFLPEKYLSFMP